MKKGILNFPQECIFILAVTKGVSRVQFNDRNFQEFPGVKNLTLLKIPFEWDWVYCTLLGVKAKI